MKKGQKYIGEVVKYEFPNKGIVEVIETAFAQLDEIASSIS